MQGSGFRVSRFRVQGSEFGPKQSCKQVPGPPECVGEWHLGFWAIISPSCGAQVLMKGISRLKPARPFTFFA